MCLAVVAVLLSGMSVSSHAQGFDQFVAKVYSAPDSLRQAIVDSFMNAVGNLPLLEPDSVVYFVYRGSASTVSVPGDADGWNQYDWFMSRLSTTNLFYLKKVFESDARLDYKFVTNGSTWILDPRNPYQCLGGFGPNSELRMSNYVPAPELVYNPAVPHGTTTDTTWFSTNLGNSRHVRVYTPPGYQATADSFPMVLVHDGLDYINLAQMPTVLDNLIAAGAIRPLIAVFVPPVDRTNEYAGSLMPQFTAFIVDELLPYIDARYRTIKSPDARATLGASNGGNISLWLGSQAPHVFGNVVAQSSYIMPSLMTAFQDSARLPLKLYLDLGTYDLSVLIPLVRNFVPVLEAKGYPYLYKEFHEGHSWGNWKAHVKYGLEFLFPGPSLSVREPIAAPRTFSLSQNYPNPFNPATTIEFRTAERGHVSLRVFDVLGREVATLVDGIVEAGTHTAQFRADRLASGIYYYRLDTGGQSQTRSLIVLR